MTQSGVDEKKPLPPYFAFKTLMDLIERMEREEPPTRVDPSYLDSYAGGYRPTVISNLQTLGLLAKTGEPTPVMLSLVSADEAARKGILRELIQQYYADILALGKNSTQGQFLAAFDNRGARGDTRRKAIAFFMKACAYAGVPVGTHWKTPPAPATAKRVLRRRTTTDPVNPEPENPRDGDGDDDHGSDVAVVRLRSGGVLTLALQGNSLTMPKDDRTFVFGIVDLMQAYEQAPEAPSPEAGEDPDEGESEEEPR